MSRHNPYAQRVVMRVSAGQDLDSNEPMRKTLPDQDIALQDEVQILKEELAQVRGDLELLEKPETVFAFGGMSFEGDGVPQDYVEAANWFRIAAEKGHSGAQHNLGVMYENGQGVSKDPIEAAKWYRLAADQGHPGSQNNLGCFYETGQGVDQDYPQAINWYRKAAANGDVNAVTSLARLEIRMKRDEYSEMVSDFLDLIDDGTPLIGDSALLSHSKKALLYAIRWMIDHYEAELDDCTHQELREKIEAILPRFSYLLTHLARDWHHIDAGDRDAINRLNQFASFPEWALALKEKYINEDKSLDQALDVTLQVIADRVEQAKAAGKETAQAEVEAAWKVFSSRNDQEKTA